MKARFCIFVTLLCAQYQITFCSKTYVSDGENVDLDNVVREKYEENWESLDSRPLPQWYDDAKVGIFLHWGVYSVPSFGSEWFWINWKNNEPNYVNFMKKNFPPDFTYQDFAMDFKAELFNATQWAMLFKESGAEYVVLTSKHHDGYALWPSSRSFSWNSMDIGPKMDLIKQLSTEIRHKGLKFGLYYSLFEWFNRLYIEDKLHLFLKNNFVNDKMMPELKELIVRYQPDVIWSDGDWEAFPDYWQSTKFLAWLYNDSPVRDTVVTNDRWGIGTNCKHGGFLTCGDRFSPGILQKHKWENAFTIDKRSWGQENQVTLSDYMTSADIVKELIVTVSCGGNVLINVGPTKYGTIQPIFEERLRDLGSWLNINGEAIYSSKPWVYQNDTNRDVNVWYTTKAVNASIYVYAIVLDYPYDSNSIDLMAFDGKKIKGPIYMLGMKSKIIRHTFNRSSDGNVLHIKFPPKNLIDKNGLKMAWTFKISLDM